MKRYEMIYQGEEVGLETDSFAEAIRIARMNLYDVFDHEKGYIIYDGYHDELCEYHN